MYPHVAVLNITSDIIWIHMVDMPYLESWIPLWGSSSEAHVMQLGKKWGLDTKRIAGDHRHTPVHLMTAPTKNWLLDKIWSNNIYIYVYIIWFSTF